MPSGKTRINSSSVPGRRVGLTIPTTPRQSAKLILSSSLRRLPAMTEVLSAGRAARAGIAAVIKLMGRAITD
jgi:hypothetical protein